MYPVIKLTPREYKHLRENPTLPEVNIWSPYVEREITDGSPVLLVIEGNGSLICPVGSAHCKSQGASTILEAWINYREGNGYKTQKDFEMECLRFPYIELTGKINNMILTDIKLFPPSNDVFQKPYHYINSTSRILFINEQFPEAIIDLLNNNLSSTFQLLPDDTVKDKSLSPLSIRQGQDKFREMLLSAYKGQCCICGEKVEKTLQAAHIQDYINENSNHVQNGLLLRADFHLMYDNGLLYIGPDYRIHFDKQVLSTSQYYSQFEGRKILLPDNIAHYPSKEALLSKLSPHTSTQADAK